jgi:hypothetical protein
MMQAGSRGANHLKCSMILHTAAVRARNSASRLLRKPLAIAALLLRAAMYITQSICLIPLQMAVHIVHYTCIGSCAGDH